MSDGVHTVRSPGLHKCLRMVSPIFLCKILKKEGRKPNADLMESNSVERPTCGFADFNAEEDLPELLSTIGFLVNEPNGLESPVGEDAGSLFWFSCECLPWLLDLLHHEQELLTKHEDEVFDATKCITLATGPQGVRYR